MPVSEGSRANKALYNEDHPRQDDPLHVYGVINKTIPLVVVLFFVFFFFFVKTAQINLTKRKTSNEV